MFFRRRKKERTTPERRGHYRHPVPPEPGLRITLRREGGEPLEGALIDLTIRGAAVCVPESIAGTIQPSDLLDVAIWSEQEQWRIETPAAVRQARCTDDPAIGIEFINLGNLYSQMENTLGRYFNRRARVRIQPEFDRPVTAHLSSRGCSLSGTVYDLSTAGMGLIVSHVEAVLLKQDAEARVRISLPGCKKDLSGTGTVRQQLRLGEQNVIGLEFDLEQEGGFCDHHQELSDYCAAVEKAKVDWESAWERDAA
jgi:c-di-GMP-binding flagellar brake protein YcgR